MPLEVLQYLSPNKKCPQRGFFGVQLKTSGRGTDSFLSPFFAIFACRLQAFFGF